MPWLLKEAWNWFWYYRRGKVKFQVWNYGDTYNACASDGKISVWNNYGSTPEAAKEMALFKLKRAQNQEPKKMELLHKIKTGKLYRQK